MNRPEYTKRECYLVLGLDENATREEVTERYHMLMKTYHPDSGMEGTGDYAQRVIKAYHSIRDGNYKPEEASVSHQSQSAPETKQSAARSSDGSYAYRQRPQTGSYGYRPYSKPGNTTTEPRLNKRDRFMLWLYPILYKAVGIAFRVSGAALICFITTFMIQKALLNHDGRNSLMMSIILFFVSLILAIIKLYIYKAAERKFVWDKGFTL